MKIRILTVIAGILSLISPLPLYAQTKLQVQTTIDTLLPGNSSGKITALRLRAAFQQALTYADPSVIDLKKYGASGNGLINSTATIQAAFALGRKVFVPKGEYLVSGEIAVSNNIECEKGAIFKVVNGYTGNVFSIKSQKDLSIKGLYIDAQGTGIKCKGLRIEGLWNSTFENYSFYANPSDTSSIGVDIHTSESTRLDFGVYILTFLNPVIFRGNSGIKTTKTALDGVGITHLNVVGGWISNQTKANFNLAFTYFFTLVNTAIDVINGVGFSLENCHSADIAYGEYTSGTLMNMDNNSSYINIKTSDNRDISSIVTGNNYSYQTSKEIKLVPTHDSLYYVKLRANYEYNNPFDIVGRFGTGTVQKILSYQVDTGLKPILFNPDNSVGSKLVGINAAGGLVKLSERKYTEGTSAPGAGTWSKGDQCINSDPDPGEYSGWLCTSGSPSTVWKGYGLIQN